MGLNKANCNFKLISFFINNNLLKGIFPILLGKICNYMTQQKIYSSDSLLPSAIIISTIISFWSINMKTAPWSLDIK